MPLLWQGDDGHRPDEWKGRIVSERTQGMAGHDTFDYWSMMWFFFSLGFFSFLETETLLGALRWVAMFPNRMLHKDMSWYLEKPEHRDLRPRSGKNFEIHPCMPSWSPSFGTSMLCCDQRISESWIPSFRHYHCFQSISVEWWLPGHIHWQECCTSETLPTVGSGFRQNSWGIPNAISCSPSPTKTNWMFQQGGLAMGAAKSVVNTMASWKRGEGCGDHNFFSNTLRFAHVRLFALKT